MAKRKDEGEEEYEFIPPDFDEDAFIHKELVSFRTTTILFVWGVIAALVSWGTYAAVGGGDKGWYIGLAIMAAMGFTLKFLFPRFKADVSDWGRKEWLGTGFLFFFAWLSFFILVINPPISDFAAPEVAVFISPGGPHAGSPGIQMPGEPVRVDLYAADNDAVARLTFQITQGATVIATQDDLQDRGNGHYQYVNDTLPAAQYAYTATVTDDHGHETTVSGVFEVIQNAVQVATPKGGTFDEATDAIIVSVTDKVEPYAVWLELEDGRRVYLDKQADGTWRGGPEAANWTIGEHTYTVVVQVMNRFHNQHVVLGGQIRDHGQVRGTPYTIDVQQLGFKPQDYAPEYPNPTSVPNRNVPGPAVPLVTLGLLGAALVLRRRD